MIIRKYQEKDKENLRAICIATAEPNITEKRKKIVVALYSDYFTEVEPQNIFVVDDGGKAVGYILCCSDFSLYKKKMKEVYLKKVAPLSRWTVFYTRLSFLLDAFSVKKYPAFLHIDILDGYQRMGLGHKLVDALIAHLKEQNIRGLCLTVGSGNQKGISFYKKYGFTPVIKGPGFIKFGLKID